MTTDNYRFFQLSPTSPAYARLEEAEAFFLLGNLNEGLAAAQQAWREYPLEPDVFRVLAYLHMARGEYPPASTAAYQAVTLNGDNPASYAILTQVYLTFNMLAKAQETIELARQRFPRDASLLVLEADLRFRKHQPARGAQLAHDALEVNSEDAYAKALLGVYRLQCKRYADSVELLRAATKAYPQRWDYLRDLGIALLHVGAVAPAQIVLAQSLRINPADRSTKQHLYLALRQLASSSAIWKVAMYFYDHTTLGWLLWIIGVLTGFVGLVWSISSIALVDSSLSLSDIITPTLLLLGGVALILICHTGIRLHNRHDNKFDMWLWKALDDGVQL